MIPNPRATISALTIEFNQDPDTNILDQVTSQALTIRFEDSGGGFFFVLDSNRWAVDDHEELAAIIKVCEEIRDRVDTYNALAD